MKDCIGKLLLSAILPGHTGSWSDSWGGDSDWNEKMHPASLSDWPLAIIRSPIFVDKLLSVVYKSVVIFLVSPDFRSDIFGPTKIWLRDLQTSLGHFFAYRENSPDTWGHVEAGRVLR
jgi:hypothetical protein